MRYKSNKTSSRNLMKEKKFFVQQPQFMQPKFYVNQNMMDIGRFRIYSVLHSEDLWWIYNWYLPSKVVE